MIYASKDLETCIYQTEKLTPSARNAYLRLNNSVDKIIFPVMWEFSY